MVQPRQILQLIVLTLLGLAVVMVQSAGVTITEQLTLRTMFTSRNAIYAGLAVLAMFAASRIDMRQIARRRAWFNPVILVLVTGLILTLAAMIPHVGVNLNGSARWLRIPMSGITFQPSELVKWAMVGAVALWCARRHDRMGRFTLGFLPIVGLIGLACMLIVKEDLGTAALIGIVSMILVLAGGARWWQVGLAAPLSVGAVVLAIAGSSYRRTRILSYLDPFADARGSGYQAIQSMLAIAQGGVTGRGLGNGIQKFGYLPVDTSDCIYAIICEELGLGGAGLVVGLYLALMWVGLGIVRRCEDRFARLFALGVILMVGIQALINIAVVTVVVPTKGIALPLLSAGGTGWIMTAFALGLVAGLDRPQPATAPTSVTPMNSALPAG